MHLPNDVIKIINTLQLAGYESFAVGGCVRDTLRGVAPKDWDITTSALPTQIKTVFSRTVDTGIKHGTITVILGKNAYEVTTYRIDGVYLDNRRPTSVSFASRIEEDLSRRDFTMNAIAYNPTRGFVDPFDGQTDIDRKIIRCVGSAAQRFSEDALRMLRAVRFAGQLGFTVDKDAINAASKLRNNLTHISAERIRDELTRLICAPYPSAITLLCDTGLLPFTLFGRVFGGDVLHIIHQLENCPVYLPMRLALFLQWTGDDCEKMLRDLRCDNKMIREVSQYVRLMPIPVPHSRYGIKKYLQHMTIDSLENLLTLQCIRGMEVPAAILDEACDIIALGEPFTIKDLAVNGDDLLSIGIPHGQRMGEILQMLLDLVMRDAHANKKAHLLDAARGFMENTNKQNL